MKLNREKKNSSRSVARICVNPACARAPALIHSRLTIVNVPVSGTREGRSRAERKGEREREKMSTSWLSQS
jgi:hypothetical protein